MDISQKFSYFLIDSISCRELQFGQRWAQLIEMLTSLIVNPLTKKLTSLTVNPLIR